MQPTALNSTAADLDIVVNDLGPLAWVLDELRKSLDGATKALKRFVRDAEAARGSDLSAIDASQLRVARQQLHQAVGALEMVGLAGPALVLRVMEAAVQRFIQHPDQCSQESAAKIERASFALTEYLEAVLADKPISAVSLFPQYRDVQELLRADRIHPADLWMHEWRWLEPVFESTHSPQSYGDSARAVLDQSVLQIMKGQVSQAAQNLRDLCLAFSVTQTDRKPRIFWKIAAAYFEALTHKLLTVDIYTRRVASRVLLQYASLSKGDSNISDRLTQDLVFFCSQAVVARVADAPVLSAVRAVYGLARFKPVDYEAVQFGRFDPALLAQARKRIVSAKETWSALSGGDANKFKLVIDQFSLVSDSLVKLHPPSEPLAKALSHAIETTAKSGQPPSIELAMEVATSVLYLEAAFDDLDPRDPQLAVRTGHLAERLESVRIGGVPQPLESWMEELYRSVSDRQTMGSVVSELRVSLGEIEKALDLFFRDLKNKAVLRSVPGQLSQMRGVLSVLGLDQASQAVLRMRESVEQMLVTEIDEHQARAAGTFDQLGNNVGAMSFLIDMLNYQPSLAKKLFIYDSERGELRPVMGRTHKPDDADSVTINEINPLVVEPMVVVERPVAPVVLAVPPKPAEPVVVVEKPVAPVVLAVPPKPAEPVVVVEKPVAPVVLAMPPKPAEPVVVVEKPVAPVVLAVPPKPAEPVVVVEKPVAPVVLAVPPKPAEPVVVVEKPVAPVVLAIPPKPAEPVVVVEKPVAPVVLAMPPKPVVVPAVQAVSHSEDEDFEEDDLRDIFLEEAREVAGNGQEALRGLVGAPTDVGHLTVLRRAFHTLKGSSRMVGLNAFGDAAWSLEQMLNSVLADQKPVTAEFRTVATEALAGFSQWIEDIATHRDAGWRAAPFCASADAMRLDERFLPLCLSADEPAQPLVDESVTVEITAAVDTIQPTALMEPLDLAGTSNAVPDVPLSPVTSDVSEAPDVIDFDFFFADELPAIVSSPEAVTVTSTIALPDESLTIDFDSLSALSVVQNVEDFNVESLAPVSLDAPVFNLTPDTVSSEPQPEFLADIVIEVGDVEVVELSDAELDKQLSIDASALQDELPAANAAVLEILADDVALAVPEFVFAETEIDTDISAETGSDEQVKVIGTLRIGIALYNVYLNEADEWSRRLVTEVSEWALECQHTVADSTVALAHSLAGTSATVGFTALSEIARAFEHALQQSQGHHTESVTAANAGLFVDAAEDIRRLLHQFAAGFLKEPDANVLHRLRALEFVDSVSDSLTDDDAELYDFVVEDVLTAEVAGSPALMVAAETVQISEVTAQLLPPLLAVVEAVIDISDKPAHAVVPLAVPASVSSFVPSSDTTDVFEGDDKDDEIDAVDAIDAELFPIFDEEAAELMPQLGSSLRQWSAHPDNQNARNEVLRALHTLKGSARLAGALRLGEMAHRIESEIEYFGSESLAAQDFDSLLTHFDSMEHTLEMLRKADAPEALSASVPLLTPSVSTALPRVELPITESLVPEALPTMTVAAPVQALVQLDVPAATPASVVLPAVSVPVGKIIIPAPQTLARQPLRQAASASIRVRSQLLDRMVNQAGEVMITRSRLEVELSQLRSSLDDMSGNLNRLRQQLRDIELQAETQMQSRLAQAKELQAGFDPLEFDRFTRVQELTRMMAESVNDVATVQRTLQRTVEATEDDLVAQARQTRELQRDLLRTRMVEFEGISDRLYRVVRLASKETSKQVRLDLLGGTIEMDRGMLDRMTPAFEHLLRNCVAHGIESPHVRVAAGKDPIGLITVHLRQEGNDVSVEFSDDGAGLDLKRIREKALILGLAEAGQVLDDQQAANMIFMPGFTTAAQVTELSGRGIGMDVVRSEVNGVGGRIETSTVAGQGTHFKLVLPLTTAVTQVVMVRADNLAVGVPANVVETVRRATAKELQQAYNTGFLDVAGESVPFFWSGALLQSSRNTSETQTKTTPVVIFRSAAQRIALHVDEVLGNQEVVVKNLGPQLSRLPGLAGMSVLASGAVVLIYNPVALATIYGEQARALSADRAEPHMLESAATQTLKPTMLAQAAPKIPLIMVVDDSITVRRVTQRLLQREGYRVVMAADGLQALERLQEERPAVVLSDIEMPRMDGFDLARNIRADPNLSGLPIVMITSRIAGKHRDHAKELGVDHYLGKPYAEDELMGLVRYYCSAEVVGA